MSLSKFKEQCRRLAQDDAANEWLDRCDRIDANEAKRDEALELLDEAEAALAEQQAAWAKERAGLLAQVEEARAEQGVGDVELELGLLRKLREETERVRRVPRPIADVIVQLRELG